MHYLQLWNCFTLVFNLFFKYPDDAFTYVAYMFHHMMLDSSCKSKTYVNMLYKVSNIWFAPPLHAISSFGFSLSEKHFTPLSFKHFNPCLI